MSDDVKDKETLQGELLLSSEFHRWFENNSDATASWLRTAHMSTITRIHKRFVIDEKKVEDAW